MGTSDGGTIPEVGAPVASAIAARRELTPTGWARAKDAETPSLSALLMRSP